MRARPLLPSNLFKPELHQPWSSVLFLLSSSWYASWYWPCFIFDLTLRLYLSAHNHCLPPLPSLAWTTDQAFAPHCRFLPTSASPDSGSAHSLVYFHDLCKGPPSPSQALHRSMWKTCSLVELGILMGTSPYWSLWDIRRQHTVQFVSIYTKLYL